MGSKLLGSLVAASCLVCLVLQSSQVNAFGMGDMPGAIKPTKAAANRKDIPFIKCQVCEALVKQAMTAVKDLRAALKPGQKLTEADIIEQLEGLCNTELDAGEWIQRFDLKHEGDALKLVDMQKIGKCDVKCATIAKACEQVQENLDLSDLSEMLYHGTTKRSALNQWACREQTSACKGKVPAVPKDRPEGVAWEPIEEDKLQQQRMMRNMKKAGLKGTLYDRQSIQNQMEMGMAGMGGKSDDDEDEDDEDLMNKFSMSSGEL